MTGSDQQFRQYVTEHQSMVYSLALRMLGDPGIAEVAQDVFLELHAWLPRLQSADHVKYWLRRVATHRATDALRRRRCRPEAAAEEWNESFERTSLRSDGGAGRGDSLSVSLERMLLSLPEPQRVALVLRYGEDLLPEEIAGITGQTVATVKSHLQRGLTLLRRKSAVVLKEFVRE